MCSWRLGESSVPSREMSFWQTTALGSGKASGGSFANAQARESGRRRLSRGCASASLGSLRPAPAAEVCLPIPY